MKDWIKENWVALMAIAISIVAICITCVRIEPVDFNNGSMVSFVVGLIGVCATIMVGIQIYSIIYSEERIKRKIKEEGKKVKFESDSDMLRTLFRVEILFINLLIVDKNWKEFVDEIALLTGYAMELEDEYRANEISKILLKIDDKYQFCSVLSNDSKINLKNQILKLCKLVNNPKELLNRFT